MKDKFLIGATSAFLMLAPMLAKADMMVGGEVANGNFTRAGNFSGMHMVGGSFLGASWVTMFLVWILLISIIFAIWHWVSITSKKKR